MLVMSYNPGYQNVLKGLKPSTRQRFVALTFGYPAPEVERGIVVAEAGVEPALAERLVKLAQALRRLTDHDLEETVSTRLLVMAARLVASGLPLAVACRAAIVDALTDNKNRAAMEVRTAISRNGGNLADPGSVSYMFNRKGVVIVPKEQENRSVEEDDVLEATLDAGPEDVFDEGETFRVISDPNVVVDVRKAVQSRIPVEFYGRMGGVMPLPDEIFGEIKRMVSEPQTTEGSPRDRWLERLSAKVS